MDENTGYSQLVQEYYSVYRQVQKKCSIRENSHFDTMGNNNIEIWKYSREKRVRRICNVHSENAAECYRLAIYELTDYLKDMQNKEAETNEQMAG